MHKLFLSSCFVVALLMVSATSAKLTAGGDGTVADPPFIQDYDLCDQVHLLGYATCEHHVAHTEDGFLLDLVRIPPTTNKDKALKPVVLQHGLFDSGIAFIANAHAYQNLGTMLADAGYDVWLPNSRGNHYSMNNTNYAPYTNLTRDLAYYQSIDCDGMAKYDLPAVIDTVLNVTKSTQLTWVGHSQGTWQAFAAFGTLHREYANKVNLFVAFGPAVLMGDALSGLERWLLVPEIEKGIRLMQSLGVHEVLAEDYFIRELGGGLCSHLGTVCPAILNLLVGTGNASLVNATNFPSLLRYTPGGSTLSNLNHWLQMIKSGVFGANNYGPTGNREHYNSTTAPVYSVSNITAPKTVLVGGLGDILADPSNVKQLAAKLNATGVLEDLIFLPHYNHLDLIWSVTAYRDVYSKVVGMINKAW